MTIEIDILHLLAIAHLVTAAAFVVLFVRLHRLSAKLDDAQREIATLDETMAAFFEAAGIKKGEEVGK